MNFYQVYYQSMTAYYGPKIISANDEYEAKRKFAGNAFRKEEYDLIHARVLSSKEIEEKFNQSN